MVSFITNSSAHIKHMDHILQEKERVYNFLETNPEDTFLLIEAMRLEFDFLENHKMLAELSEPEKSQLTEQQALDVIDQLLQEYALSANIFASTRLQGKIEQFIHLKGMRFISQILVTIQHLRENLAALTPDQQQLLVNLQSLAVKLSPLSLDQAEKDLISCNCYEYLSSALQAQPLAKTSNYSFLCENLQNQQNKEQIELEKVLMEIFLKANLNKFSVSDPSKLPVSVQESLKERNQDIIAYEAASLKDRKILPISAIFGSAHEISAALSEHEQQTDTYLDFLEFLQAALAAYRIMLKKEAVISMLKFNHISGLIQELSKLVPERCYIIESILVNQRHDKKMDVVKTQEFLGLQGSLGKEEELEEKLGGDVEDCVSTYKETIDLIDDCVKAAQSQERFLSEEHQEKFQLLLNDLDETILLWEEKPEAYGLFIALKKLLENDRIRADEIISLFRIATKLKKLIEEDHEQYFKERVASEEVADVLQALSL